MWGFLNQYSARFQANADPGDHNPGRQSRTFFVLILLVGAFLFSLAYAQSPLYTSNQNQYFLHGLSQSGYGFLDEDWLASTRDPTPIFSLIISWSHSLFQSRTIFSVYYLLLSGIYFISLMLIGDLVYQVRSSKFKSLFLAAIIIATHAYLTRLTISKLLGANWDYLFDGGVAGQRLLGTVFQPSLYGVFLLLSIYCFMIEKRFWSVSLLVLTVSIHPTYLLSAAVLTIAYLIIDWINRRSFRSAFILGFSALIGVFPILIYVYGLFVSSTKVDGALAREILVNQRIPHHAIPAEWFDISVIAKLGFIILGVLILRHKKLIIVMGTLLVTALLLTSTQIITNSNTLALIFPWRISTILVPLSTMVLAGSLASKFSAHVDNKKSIKFKNAAVWISMAIMLIFTAAGITKSLISYQENLRSTEQNLFTFIRQNKKRGETYLIPIKMQDFRLETGAPAYVDFKSIPYRDVDVIEWRRRLDLANSIYLTPGGSTFCDHITALFSDEGITGIILPAEHPASSCPGIHLTYQDKYYSLFKLDL
jgi:hypothetical protein